MVVTSTTTTKTAATKTPNNAVVDEKDDIETGFEKGRTVVVAVGDDADGDGNGDGNDVKHPVLGVDNNSKRETDDDNEIDIDDDNDDDDYVTYIRPKQIKILPPAKYKLFLVTFVAVWFAEWVASLAGMYTSIQTTTNLSHNGTMFLLFGTIVAVLVFGTIELMIKYIKITIPRYCCSGNRGNSSNGNDNDAVKIVLGIGPWFKQPRIQFFKRYTNVISQSCDRIIHILENGFDLFSTAPPPPPSPPSQSSSSSSTTTASQGRGGSASSPSVHGHRSKNHHFDCAKPEDAHSDVVLRIVSRVQPTKVNDYKKWVKDFQSMGCLSRPGMKHIYTNFVEDDEVENGMMRPKLNRRRKVVPSEDDHNDDGDGVVYVWYITFANIDYLNDFMTSPVRDRMVQNLQPLLVTKTLYQLTNERSLPDTFTDIVTPQSGTVPSHLPSKWKVWTVTTLSLWFTNMILDATIRDYYYNVWGVNDAHPRARATLSVFFNVFFNVYIMVPFLTMLLGHWLKRKDDEHTTHEPWRTFNDGLKTDWAKVLVTIAYYGGCVLGYIVKSA